MTLTIETIESIESGDHFDDATKMVLYGRNGGGNRSNCRAVSDGSDPRQECDNVYVGDGKCVCWRCGKETDLCATARDASRDSW